MYILIISYPSAFIMDISKNFWVHIAGMNKARNSHACGIINHDNILVAGGNDDIGNILDSVEMFSPITMKWDYSTPLPSPLSSEASLQYGSTVIIFNGLNIYQFVENSFEWSMREETLLTERSEYVAIPITGMESIINLLEGCI